MPGPALEFILAEWAGRGWVSRWEAFMEDRGWRKFDSRGEVAYERPDGAFVATQNSELSDGRVTGGFGLRSREQYEYLISDKGGL